MVMFMFPFIQQILIVHLFVYSLYILFLFSDNKFTLISRAWPVYINIETMTTA